MSFPGSPRTLRGALVSVQVPSLAPTVVAFQYNPHTLTRSFELRGAQSGPDTGQLTGPPAETIKLDVELDATDDMERGGGQLGVSDRLAALERLVTPDSLSILTNQLLAAIGTIEILPPERSLTLFVWGPRRVLPVVVTELSITEEAHDPSLVPTRARASLGLRVLTTADVSPTHPAFALAFSNLVAKETLGLSASSGSLESVLGDQVRLF